MKQYRMTPSLRTGNKMIDTEHQRIFDEANVLLKACHEGHAREHLREMAEFLADYVGIHFSDEEDLQIRMKYPDYPEHKEFHEWYKKELRKNLDAARTEPNMFNVLGQINRVMEVLLKHIETEDTRLAKWVKERESETVGRAEEHRVSSDIGFSSAFQSVSGKKEVDLRALIDMAQLQKQQELFAEATGMACAVADLSGRYITKGSGSSIFLSRYAQGRHEELLEFTESLVIDGYQVGMVVGGVVESEQMENSHVTRSSVTAAGQMFAEMINYWINTVAEEKRGAGSQSAFEKEAHHVQEAIHQIKNRAKGLEQTATMEKMLSLNAAIEAGRAGKAGVGFAVVAEEIGRMANESAAVYREIQDLVRQVEESMDRLEQNDL